MLDSLIKLYSDFYDSIVIEEAKQILYSCVAVTDTAVRHQRRQGPSKDKHNMEVFLLVLHKCSTNDGLPEFVASDLSCLPMVGSLNLLPVTSLAYQWWAP